MVIAFVGAKGIPYQSSLDRREHNLEYISTQLVARGHKVYVLAKPEYTDLTEYQGVDILPTSNHLWLKIHTLQTIPNLDVVHIMSLHDAWIAFWVSVLMPNVRIIFECHDYTFNPNIITSNQEKQLLTYIATTFSHEIIVEREDLANFFKHQTKKKKIHQIRPGLEIHPTRQNDSIKTWNLLRHQYILVNSYAYRNQKDLKLVIEAYHKLKLNYPLVVMGSVHPDIKSRYQSPNIRYIGAISGQTEREIIANARFFIETSTMREDKTSLYLALSYATPTLTEYHSVHTNLIGSHGLYFRSNNLASLINTMKFMVQVQPIMQARAYEFKNNIKDLFSLEGKLNRYIYLYVNSYQHVAKPSSKSIPRISIPIQ